MASKVTRLHETGPWHLDGTFKVVSLPFTQLFTVNAFITKGTASKQVPLAVCLMSGRRTDDYTAVLKTMKDSLPSLVQVTDFMLDFERAMWPEMDELNLGKPHYSPS